MVKRVSIEVAAILALTILLAFVGIMLLIVLQGLSSEPLPVTALRVLLGATGLAIAMWTVMLIVGSIVLRRRPVSMRIGVHILTAGVAVVVNTAVLALLTMGSDGWGGLIVAISLGAGLALLVAAAIAVVVVERLVVERLSGSRAPAGG